jgi:ribose transport system ATP-binding protein
MPAVSVEISDVRKTFGPTVALGGVSLRAYEGEVHAIIGGNGSGKSTLAKVMSGVLVPDAGQVSVMGKVATTPYEAREIGISNVFQEVLVADECSVLDNLYLGADGLLGSELSHEDRRAKASVLMTELLGYDLDLETPVGDLPLSIKQWITIARAMLTDPRVLILDESSAALDFESTERLFRKMREMKRRGTAIMIVTHRIAELVRIADRATVLRDGRTVGTLEQDEITEARILALIAGPEREKAMGGQTHAERLSDTPVLRLTEARVWDDGSSFDFNLFPGEIVGITGLDGQGQADFVRALAGVQPLIGGRITMVRDGQAEVIRDLRSARENGISYVSGDRKKEGIFANLGIFENMALPIYQAYHAGGWFNFINRTKLTPVFEWEASKLAIKMGAPDNLITSLSGGNQQKVLIARAFAEKPTVLMLNDPARGIDIGAKLDLYRNLRDFAARGNAVVFLSSEIEEFLNLCTRVLVFRGGAVSSSFDPPFDGHVILNAMFGRRATALLPGEAVMAEEAHHFEGAEAPVMDRPQYEDGRPIARPVRIIPSRTKEDILNQSGFLLIAPDIPQGAVIPERFAETSRTSPALRWQGVPAGTQSFALSVTDPDLPPEFNFPRSFAHWLVHDIPGHLRELPEGASGSLAMPSGVAELHSDFVTFHIPGFGRGWGGPWPPDRQHRYVFTLFALKVPRLALPTDADLTAFAAAVLPVTIDQSSFTAVYGPARNPLPTP